MTPTHLGLLLFGAALMAVLVFLWLMPTLERRRQERELQALHRMHRFALKHNTFVRKFQGVRFVVVLGQRGFHYMLGGQFVSRAQLLKAIGEENEKVLLKAESEESQHGPVKTLATSPA
ncbi:hypothetical protein DV704_09905 [Meiothermus sp. QL-1]|uniref:hypothetical protein n=1 Tax=Meiothermus sp. QL-1 TaxID=2058095 RepID=UPI000E0B0F0E|nr:hypothetical protein [Meiothermus sp. QL-1]RDI94784.1 hypothetical protein DV704_09905 [Meiothermus sp. QL-1]